MYHNYFHPGMSARTRRQYELFSSCIFQFVMSVSARLLQNFRHVMKHANKSRNCLVEIALYPNHVVVFQTKVAKLDPALPCSSMDITLHHVRTGFDSHENYLVSGTTWYIVSPVSAT